MGAHEQQLVDRFIDAAMPLGGVFGLVTTRFISIATPDGPIDVCRDVPCPGYLGGARFPSVLDPLRNADLVGLAARFGQSVAEDVSASNALTWESYDERMGFILTFFRAYQRDERFFALPEDMIGPVRAERPRLGRRLTQGGGDRRGVPGRQGVDESHREVVLVAVDVRAADDRRAHLVAAEHVREIEQGHSGRGRMRHPGVDRRRPAARSADRRIRSSRACAGTCSGRSPTPGCPRP